MINNPLVRGGQGHSAESLITDAKSVAYCVVIAMIVLTLAAVTN